MNLSSLLGRRVVVVLDSREGASGVLVRVGLVWLRLHLADGGQAWFRRSRVDLVVSEPAKEVPRAR